MMFLTKAARALAISAALFASSPVMASTLVDFEELAHDGAYTFHNPLTIDGFVFASSTPGAGSLGVWGTTSSNNADPGGATLFNNFQDTTTTITSLSGLFDFTSIDLADVYNNGSGGDIRFDFTDGSGTTSEIVTIDNLPGLETFSFGRTGLTSVSYTPLTTQGPWVQVDNVLFNGNIGGAVPEPGTWAMLLIGFGFVGGAMRSRRRQKRAVSYA